MKERVIDFIRSTIVIFLYLLIIFILVMGSFFMSIEQDVQEGLLISMIYFFPSIFLALLISVKVFMRMQLAEFILKRSYNMIALIISIIYVILTDILALVKLDISDFQFGFLIISTYLITMSILTLTGVSQTSKAS